MLRVWWGTDNADHLVDDHLVDDQSCKFCGLLSLFIKNNSVIGKVFLCRMIIELFLLLESNCNDHGQMYESCMNQGGLNFQEDTLQEDGRAQFWLFSIHKVRYASIEILSLVLRVFFLQKMLILLLSQKWNITHSWDYFHSDKRRTTTDHQWHNENHFRCPSSLSTHHRHFGEEFDNGSRRHKHLDHPSPANLWIQIEILISNQDIFNKWSASRYTSSLLSNR